MITVNDIIYRVIPSSKLLTATIVIKARLVVNDEEFKNFHHDKSLLKTLKKWLTRNLHRMVYGELIGLSKNIHEAFRFVRCNPAFMRDPVVQEKFIEIEKQLKQINEKFFTTERVTIDEE